MKNYLLILFGFIMGVIFTVLVSIYSIKITRVESNGKNVNNAGITISIFGNKFDYYYEKEE